VCKKLIKNSQPFGKYCQKTAGGGGFLTHTVVCSSVMHFGTHTFSVVCPNTTAGAHTSMEDSYLVQDGTKNTSPIRWLCPNCPATPCPCNDYHVMAQMLQIVGVKYS